ncbi:MAG: Trk system potassium transporter TrkA [Actinobacteria bacterium]|nr:Trk system potassium transporter TrkA [Actinomycetota bacterium]
MNIFVIGAGQVGVTIVQALHDDHHLTVFDLDESRLAAISSRYDVSTLQGNGASRRVLSEAGVSRADLLIACTSRDESNIVSAMISKALSPRTTTIVRTTNPEYLDVWREGQLDVDFIVSSEIETAHAVSRTVGVPAARQTDLFAEGQVQLVEFDVSETTDTSILGLPLREAVLPPDARLAAIIRGADMRLPGGDDVIGPGDRIVVIGSPQAAQSWGELIAPGSGKVTDVVIFGAGHAGTAIARTLLSQGIGVRMIESVLERARAVANELSDARVYHATGLDPDFLERERIADAQVAIFAMRDDMKNHFAATLAKIHGARFTIAIVHDGSAVEVFEQAGIDVTIDPRQVTAEEIVRFAHDPRTQQVSMLEGDRFEVLDITTRPGSEYAGMTFKEMPIRGALIAALVRNGQAIFPRSDDILRPGDRAIIFTESRRVSEVEKAL